MDSDSSPTKKGSKKGRGRGTSTTPSARGRPRGRGRGKRAVKVLNYSLETWTGYYWCRVTSIQVIISDGEDSEGEEQISINKSTDVENEKPPSPELTIKHAQCKKLVFQWHLVFLTLNFQCPSWSGSRHIPAPGTYLYYDPSWTPRTHAAARLVVTC